jgi:hypothetical protein
MEWQRDARKAFFSLFLPGCPKKRSLTRVYVVFAPKCCGLNPGQEVRAFGWVLDDTKSEIKREKPKDKTKSREKRLL